MARVAKDAQLSARWVESGSVWLDHAQLAERDIEWLASAQDLTIWNVKFPEGFLSRLPLLERLDVRGGAGEDLDFIEGCEGLRYLTVNQVRGVVDVSAVAGAIGLEFLSLFGLPQVRRLPSMAELTRLDRVELGSMKGLIDLAGLFAAPALTELVFLKAMGASQSDATTIAEHPSIKQFEWFAEDVPSRVWKPFVERVGKPKAKFDWWARHGLRSR